MAWASTRLALCIALLLPGCGLLRDQADPNAVGAGGVKPTLEQLSIESTAAAQDRLLTALVATAGLKGTDGRPVATLGTHDANWQLVYKAGVYEIGRQCDQYLEALFRFNREQRATRQGLAATAAATAGIMGLTGVGAKAIAITAASFGLTTALFDATVNSVLFTIEPSALRNVAAQGLQHYYKSIDPNKITTRPDTLIALQGYLTQCSPAAIEANINNAASGAPSVASSDPDTAKMAAMLAAPNSALLVATGKSEVLPPPRPKQTILGALEKVEETTSLEDGRKIKMALCLTPEPVGRPVSFGPDVRKAIDLFRAARQAANKGGLTLEEKSLLTIKGSCGKQYLNAFESFRFSTPADIKWLQDQLGQQLAKSPNGSLVPQDGSLGQTTRDAIVAVKKIYCQPETSELTRGFVDMMIEKEPPTAC